MGDYEEAMRQIEGIRRVLWTADKKLFHHIRIDESGEFKDPSFSGGGNGWCTAATAQIFAPYWDEMIISSKVGCTYTCYSSLIRVKERI